jgi:hypothetical protein
MASSFVIDYSIWALFAKDRDRSPRRSPSSHRCNLLTADPAGIIGGFFLHGCYAGAICGRNPSYLTGRFPTEVRSTAAGFCYHQGAGGFVVPILTCLAPVSVLVSE